MATNNEVSARYVRESSVRSNVFAFLIIFFSIFRLNFLFDPNRSVTMEIWVRWMRALFVLINGFDARLQLFLKKKNRRPI